MLCEFLKKKNNLIKMVISAIIISLLDVVFLYLLSNKFGRMIKNIQNEKIKLNYVSAMLCYIIMIIGLNYFIISQNKSVYDAFILGVLVYATYELTSKAVIKKWEWSVVCIDSLWGGILFASTTFLTYKKYKLLKIK